MTIPTFLHEETIKVGEDVLHLSLDFYAFDAIEREAKRPFDALYREITGGADEGAATSTMAIVLWGLLRRHNPEVDLGQTTWLVNDRASVAPLSLALGRLFEAAFAPVTGAPPPRPRKPRGASKSSSSPGAPSA